MQSNFRVASDERRRRAGCRFDGDRSRSNHVARARRRRGRRLAGRSIAALLVDAQLKRSNERLKNLFVDFDLVVGAKHRPDLVTKSDAAHDDVGGEAPLCTKHFPYFKRTISHDYNRRRRRNRDSAELIAS